MNAEVVIPTLEPDPVTLESVPDGVAVHLQDEPTIAAARNAGVENVDADVVVMIDDDVRFEEGQFHDLVAAADPDTLVGLAGWNYGLVVTRVMVFHRELWETVGGFDERLGSHMEDTDFAIRALEHGYELERLPRDRFHHVGDNDAPQRMGKLDHAWRGLYLAAKHPAWAPRLFVGMVRGAL